MAAELIYQFVVCSIFLFVINVWLKDKLDDCRFPYALVFFIFGLTLGLASDHLPELDIIISGVQLIASRLVFIHIILLLHLIFSLDVKLFEQKLLDCVVVTASNVVCSAITFWLYCYVVYPAVLKLDTVLSVVMAVVLSTSGYDKQLLVYKGIGVSKEISVLLNGSSVISCFATIVAYYLVFDVSTNKAGFIADGFSFIFYHLFFMCVVGPVLGICVGQLVFYVISRIVPGVPPTLFVLFASFGFVFGTRSAFALTGVGFCAAFVYAYQLSSYKAYVNEQSLKQFMWFFDKVKYIALSILFLQAGWEIGTELTTFLPTYYLDFIVIFVSYLVWLISRIAFCLGTYPFMSRRGYDWKTLCFISFVTVPSPTSLTFTMYLRDTFRNVASSRVFYQVVGIILISWSVAFMISSFVAKRYAIFQLSFENQQRMNVAYAALNDAKKRSISILRMDPSLVLANWLTVERHVQFVNPYGQRFEENPMPSLQTVPSSARVLPPHICDFVRSELNKCYWNMHDNNLLSWIAAYKLCSATKDLQDIPLNAGLPSSNKISQMMKVPWAYAWLKPKLSWAKSALSRPKPPCTKTARQTKFFFSSLINISWFSWINTLWFYVHVIGTLTVAVLTFWYYQYERDRLLQLGNITLGFFGCFCLEIFLKIIVFGWRAYYRKEWHKFDLALAAVLVVDVGICFSTAYVSDEFASFHLVTVIMLLRGLRILRPAFFIKPFLLKIVVLSENYINNDIYQRIEIGNGFIYAVNETKKLVPGQLGYSVYAEDVLLILNKSRLKVLKTLGDVQNSYKEVNAAGKSHLASKKVIHDMEEELKNLSKHGEVSEEEFDLLNLQFKKMKKKVFWAPRSITPLLKPMVILNNVPWLSNENVIKEIQEYSDFKIYPEGSVLREPGQYLENIGVLILSGKVKVTGKRKRNESGALVNSDSFLFYTGRGEFEDYLTEGNSFGFLDLIANAPGATRAVCETETHMCLIPRKRLRRFEFRLAKDIWFYIALQITRLLLRQHPVYESLNEKELRFLMKNCYFPDLLNITQLAFPPSTTNVILVQGKAFCERSENIYRAPCRIPVHEKGVHFEVEDEAGRYVRPVVLVATDDDVQMQPEHVWSNKTRMLDLNIYGKGTRESYDDFRSFRSRRSSSLPSVSSAAAAESIQEQSREIELDELITTLGQEAFNVFPNIDVGREVIITRRRRGSHSQEILVPFGTG